MQHSMHNLGLVRALAAAGAVASAIAVVSGADAREMDWPRIVGERMTGMPHPGLGQRQDLLHDSSGLVPAKLAISCWPTRTSGRFASPCRSTRTGDGRSITCRSSGTPVWRGDRHRREFRVLLTASFPWARNQRA
jgi:hypothetical protein